MPHSGINGQLLRGNGKISKRINSVSLWCQDYLQNSTHIFPHNVHKSVTFRKKHDATLQIPWQRTHFFHPGPRVTFKVVVLHSWQASLVKFIKCKMFLLEYNNDAAIWHWSLYFTLVIPGTRFHDCNFTPNAICYSLCKINLGELYKVKWMM